MLPCGEPSIVCKRKLDGYGGEAPPKGISGDFLFSAFDRERHVLELESLEILFSLTSSLFASIFF